MPRSWPKRIALVLLAAFFVFAGVTHFTNPEFFIAIVPAWLPNPPLMVASSGVAEILGGIGVLIPKTRRLAGWGLIALLVAVYPANVDMALHPDKWLAQGMTKAQLWGRLPFQFLFLAWTWWATKPDRGQSAPPPSAEAAWRETSRAA
jgi:uncharacterized membrane protein